MYRFNRKDNAAAAALFGHAVSRDPDFARAHAGLSFTHFQAAFLRHTADVAGEIARARHCAERGLELDPLDPFVNFAMGRSYWLEGDLEGGLGWLERSVEVCPNYAQGIYARAWTEAAGWAERAACSPGAHVLIAMIAVAAHALGGEPARAAYWAANVRSRNPALTREEFFCSFPMKLDRMRARVSGALARFGF
jgi:tetratricopeptide (TPR) repeat protein